MRPLAKAARRVLELQGCCDPVHRAHGRCALDTRFARLLNGDTHLAKLLQPAARFAGLLHGISRSAPLYRGLCSFGRVMSRRTGKSCSFCTALARFCSRCTVAFDIARNNRAKRVCRALSPVRPAITVHFEQSRTQDGSRRTRIDSPPACPASAPVPRHTQA